MVDQKLDIMGGFGLRTAKMELGTAKFPVFSLVNREFDLRDEFARDWPLRHISI
jgi:hypothetical protein